jgi:hypothetical protein
MRPRDLGLQSRGQGVDGDPAELDLGFQVVVEAIEQHRVEEPDLVQIRIVDQNPLEAGGGRRQVSSVHLITGIAEVEVDVLGLGQNVREAHRIAGTHVLGCGARDDTHRAGDEPQRQPSLKTVSHPMVHHPARAAHPCPPDSLDETPVESVTRLSFINNQRLTPIIVEG